MLTNELNSKALAEALKAAGFNTDYLIWFESPEIGRAEVVADGRTWSLDGVPMDAATHRLPEEVLGDLHIHMQTSLVFSSQTQAEWVLAKWE